MAAAADRNWWRKVLVIATLPFAALGVTGCDNTEPGGEEGIEQEATTGTEETAGSGETIGEEESTPEEESATEGELPYEDGQQEEGQGGN
ncbi:hypothetical protein [Kocuria oceani]|uniref:Uncharacterized protein n=1 Tax=Kocuria oceani TaxID=988827 RepID=A0ABV9TL69_9MICC|nr:hypothetical protein [Kocuria oceani]